MPTRELLLCCCGAQQRAGHGLVLQRVQTPLRGWGSRVTPLRCTTQPNSAPLENPVLIPRGAAACRTARLAAGAEQGLSQDSPTPQTASPVGRSVFQVSEHIKAQAAWPQTQALVHPQPDPIPSGSGA